MGGRGTIAAIAVTAIATTVASAVVEWRLAAGQSGDDLALLGAGLEWMSILGVLAMGVLIVRKERK
jgi:hypothetical protein